MCKQPHQWANVIEAISQGKSIQVSVDLIDRWQDVDDIRIWNPIRYPEYKWRVKPELTTLKGYVIVRKADFYPNVFTSLKAANAWGKSLCDFVKIIEITELIEV